jgi:hypothetical protein
LYLGATVKAEVLVLSKSNRTCTQHSRYMYCRLSPHKQNSVDFVLRPQNSVKIQTRITDSSRPPSKRSCRVRRPGPSFCGRTERLFFLRSQNPDDGALTGDDGIPRGLEHPYMTRLTHMFVFFPSGMNSQKEAHLSNHRDSHRPPLNQINIASLKREKKIPHHPSSLAHHTPEKRETERDHHPTCRNQKLLTFMALVNISAAFGSELRIKPINNNREIKKKVLREDVRFFSSAEQ